MESVAQTTGGGFQCCSCCGKAGKKRPGCSCIKPFGYTHVCLKASQTEEEQEKEQHLREEQKKHLAEYRANIAKLKVERAKEKFRCRKWKLFALHLIYPESR